MFGLEVVNPGVLSLIQDLGRQGTAHLGLSPGGPADLHAFCWGNKLLGNCPNAAGIEITVGQASFRALEDMTIAITGAQMQAKIDGKAQSNWHKLELKQGQLLSFDIATSGLRAYITVAGGLDAPMIFGSAATVCRNQLGGLATAGNVIGLGKKLQQEDVISLAHMPLSHPPHINHFVPRRYIPQYPHQLMINVIESYQCDSFKLEQKARFYQGEYVVTPHSDRMGICLSGPAITSTQVGIISEGIAPGSIQIPPNGQPIVLLNDRQTLGGYPKFGCITRRDQSRIAQATSGTIVRFHQANLKHETLKWCQFLKFFNL